MSDEYDDVVNDAISHMIHDKTHSWALTAVKDLTVDGNPKRDFETRTVLAGAQGETDPEFTPGFTDEREMVLVDILAYQLDYAATLLGYETETLGMIATRYAVEMPETMETLDPSAVDDEGDQ